MANSSEKTAWILGASGGIGSSLTELLSSQGWRLIVSGRDASKLEALATERPNLHPLPLDATKPEAVAETADHIFSEFGRLDGVVHLVGSFMLKGAHQLSIEEWKQTLDINLNSAFYVLKAVVGPMQKEGGGTLVFTSTVAAQTGLPSHEAIAAAKAGVDGLVRSAAATYATRGLRVNSVAPGMTETPLSAPVLANETSRKVTERMHPLGRVGRPREIASAIAWLLSDDAAWVTGQTIGVDGGLSRAHPRPRI